LQQDNANSRVPELEKQVQDVRKPPNVINFFKIVNNTKA